MSGASFTEGDGAPYDSSYIAILRRNLQHKYPSVEILNAGNCGSDPFFNFKNLEDRLIAYQPDLVIQSFTTNDMDTDMMIRGGMERFQADGTLKFRNKYWWEQVYASSYIVRLLIISVGGYNNRLIKKSEIPQIRAENEKKVLALFKRYKEYSEQKHFDFLVFNVAFKYDYTSKTKNEVDYKFMPQILELGINFKSLRSCYDDYFRTNRKTYNYYYWETDAHHNARGYEMMALCLQPEIEQYLEKFYGNDSTGN